MANNSRYRDQLESLYGISAQIASLRNLTEAYDLALTFCLALTASEMGFIDLLNEGHVDMDVVAVKGFAPPDPQFYERFKRMPVRPSVFGIVITEGRPHISNDVENDPVRVGEPPGHPDVRTFLGVPLQLGTQVIGMIGVANKRKGYVPDDERLLSTFANQVAVAIDNAGLYQHQQEMIVRLQQLHEHLSKAERDELVALERERMAAAFRVDPGETTPARPRLNDSQQEILRLLTEGLSNKEIASRIHLSENTVKTHIQEILRRLEVRNRVQAQYEPRRNDGCNKGAPPLRTALRDAPSHPAVRARNRGRRTGRGLDRSPQRAWATPLEVLLVAERAALLAGRHDDGRRRADPA